MLGGLRLHLVREAVRLRAPLLLLAGLSTFVFHGWAPWMLFFSLLAAFGLQFAVGHAASFMIIPVQRRAANFLRKVTGSALGRKWIPVVILEEVGGMLHFMERMHASAHTAKDEMLTTLQGECFGVRTPDGALLHTVVFGGGAAQSPRGVLVYVGGNAELCALNRTWAAFSRKYRLSVVIFDYRGVGESEGTISRDGGVTDTASIIAFAQGSLGYAPEKVLVFGHSIGGSFATEAAPFFPGVSIVNDRSFGQLSAVAWCHLYPPCLHPELSGSVRMRLIRWLIRDAVRFIACWELDPARHWLSIPQARKAVMFHTGDRVIPFPVQLRTHLAMEHRFDAEGARSVADDAPQRAAEAGWAPECFGLGAVVQLGRAAAPAGGRVAGMESLAAQGGDPHNREMTLSEERRFFAGVVEPLLGYSSTVGASVRPLPSFVDL